MKDARRGKKVKGISTQQEKSPAMKNYSPLIILFIIATGLLVIAYFVIGTSTAATQDQPLFWGDILKNIGLTVLTVVAITLLWNLLGGDPVDKSISRLDNTLGAFQSSVKLLEDSKVSGLQRVLAVSGEFGSHTDWMNRLKSAENSIDLLGYDLLVWTKGENFENEVKKLVENGVHVRVLIMDENNPDLSAFTNTAQIRSLSIELVKENIRIVKEVFKGIKESLSPNFQAKLEFRSLKQGLIPLQLCRTDNRLTMVQYIFSEVASRSPLLLVEGEESTLFAIYKNEFNLLWELAVLEVNHG